MRFHKYELLELIYMNKIKYKYYDVSYSLKEYVL